MKGRHVEGRLRLGPQPLPHRAGAAHRAAAVHAVAAGRGVEPAVAGGEIVAAAGERPDRAGGRGRARRRRRRAAARAAGARAAPGAPARRDRRRRARARACTRSPTGETQASPLRRAQAVKGCQGGPPKGKSGCRAERRGQRRRSPARTSGSSGSAAPSRYSGLARKRGQKSGPSGPSSTSVRAALRRAVARPGVEGAERRQAVRPRPRRDGRERHRRRSAPDQRAGAVGGEELEQHRVRRAAVEDHHRAHPAVDGVERGLRSSGSCRRRWCRRRSSRARRRR